MFHIHINTPNITDWIQVLLSIITILIAILGTYYVRKTFQEQQSINREQLLLASQQKELNRLSMEKDRRSIQPRFRVSIRGAWYQDEFFLVIWVSNATAYDINIQSTSHGAISPSPNRVKYEEWETNTKREFYIDREMLWEEDKLPQYAPLVDECHLYTLEYKDVDGRIYKQDVWFDENRAWTTLPDLLVKYENVNQPAHNI